MTETPNLLESCAPDLASAIGTWQTWLKVEKNVSPHTFRAYTADIGQFIAFMSRHHGRVISFDHLSATSLSDFRSWLSSRVTDGLGAASRARSLSGVKNFLHWLDKQGILHNAAILIVRTPKLSRKIFFAMAPAATLPMVSRALLRPPPCQFRIPYLVW